MGNDNENMEITVECRKELRELLKKMRRAAIIEGGALVIGVVLLIAVVVTLGAVVFVIISDLGAVPPSEWNGSTGACP